MHRDPLLGLIDKYKQKHPNEREMIGKFREFVGSNSDCFERSLKIGHITGAALITDAGRTRVLLTHHAKLNIWLQPGGHADGQPDVFQVALREVVEETGLKQITPVHEEIFDLDVHLIPARKNDPDHYHYDVRFLMTADMNHNLIISHESHDLAWVPLSNISNYTSEPSIHRMIQKLGTVPDFSSITSLNSTI
jgi:8-oxo-dGTP pyrophosphatase MutT (NUDIX family)